MTLPLWRDKLAAELAAAQAGKRAAAARLTAEQIGLAVDVAARTYDYRESTRNLALLEEQLIPKAQKSLALARAGYLSGRVDFSNLRDAERTWLNLQLTEIQERARREITLAELSLVIAGRPPAGARCWRRGINTLNHIWAIYDLPFTIYARRGETTGLKGRNMTAQGNALGMAPQ